MRLTADQKAWRRAIMFIACAMVSQLSCTRTPKQVDFSTAKAAYSKSDNSVALNGFRQAAQQGNPEAQVLLATMYEKGQGVQQNYAEAVHWYKLAALRQNPVAEYAVGKFYADGQGVPKDTTEAVKWLRLASQHGSGDASYYLGDMYYRGTGVPVDRYEAVKLGALASRQSSSMSGLGGCWLAEGAYNPKENQPKGDGEYLKWLKFGVQNGVASAQLLLGVEYHDGGMVPQQYAEAAKLFRLAATQDSECEKPNISVHLAQRLLGDLYQFGRGVPVDHVEAAKWYRMAADSGLPEAQYAFGVALVRGEGVPQDYSEGIRYYRLAAEQGNRKAQGALGAMYFSGMGVPQDYVQAHLWLNLAAVDGDKQLLKIRAAVEHMMTPTQLAEAQKISEGMEAEEERVDRFVPR